MRKPLSILVVSAVATLAGQSALAAIDKPECIGARSRAAASTSLQAGPDVAHGSQAPEGADARTYMPAASAPWPCNTVVAQRAADPNVIVAFSGGSLL